MHRFFDYVWVNVSILTDITGKRNNDRPGPGLISNGLFVWLSLPAFPALGLIRTYIHFGYIVKIL